MGTRRKSYLYFSSLKSGFPDNQVREFFNPIINKEGKYEKIRNGKAPEKSFEKFQY